MAEKPKSGEKSKRVESEPNHPTKRKKLAEKTREEMKDLIQLRKFEESGIGHEILAGFGSISKILESENLLNPVLAMLAVVADDENREAIFVFLKAASKKFPEVMQDSVRDPDFDGPLRDRLISEMGWDAAELPIKVAKPAKPRQTAEKPKLQKAKEIVDYSAVVEEMKKTEAFKVVLDQFDADDLMKVIRASIPTIDWDEVMIDVDREGFSTTKGIMAYLKERKLTATQPKANAFEALMSDPKGLESLFDKLGYVYGDVDPRHFGAFVMMVAETNPKFVFDYYTNHPFAEVRDVASKEAAVRLLKAKGFPATEKLFEPPAEDSNPSEG